MWVTLTPHFPKRQKSVIFLIYIGRGSQTPHMLIPSITRYNTTSAITPHIAILSIKPYYYYLFCLSFLLPLRLPFLLPLLLLFLLPLLLFLLLLLHLLFLLLLLLLVLVIIMVVVVVLP